MTMDEIHDFDEDGDPTRYAAEDEAFTIQDDAQAAWAMRKALAAQIRIDANNRIAEAERGRIDTWQASVNARSNRDLAYFQGLLIRYASEQRVVEGRKTIDTPYGVVKSRQGTATISVSDPDEFIAWARQGHENLLNVKVTPALRELKAFAEIESTPTLGVIAISKDGEVIPGVQVDPGSITYTVEVSK